MIEATLVVAKDEQKKQAIHETVEGNVSSMCSLRISVVCGSDGVSYVMDVWHFIT